MFSILKLGFIGAGRNSEPGRSWCFSATCEAVSSPWDRQEILRSVGIKIKEMSSFQISLGALLLPAPRLPCLHSLQFTVLTLWPKGYQGQGLCQQFPGAHWVVSPGSSSAFLTQFPSFSVMYTYNTRVSFSCILVLHICKPHPSLGEINLIFIHTSKCKHLHSI